MISVGNVNNNNNNNNNRLISQDKPLDHNTEYIYTSVTQDSYLGLGCHAGQPMVLDQRWAAADSGPSQPTETLSPPENSCWSPCTRKLMLISAYYSFIDPVMDALQLAIQTESWGTDAAAAEQEQWIRVDECKSWRTTDCSSRTPAGQTLTHEHTQLTAEDRYNITNSALIRGMQSEDWIKSSV